MRTDRNPLKLAVLVLALAGLLALPLAAEPLSAHATEQAAVGPAACNPDAYEPDDQRDQASALAINGPATSHTFHAPADVDWLVMQAAGPGVSYNIRTDNLVAGTDTFMFIYDRDGFEVRRNDDIDPAKCRAGQTQFCASSATWLAAYAGPYYALVLNLGRGSDCPGYDIAAQRVGLWLPLIGRDMAPAPTATPTATPTVTDTPTPTATWTATPTPTGTATPTPSVTPTPTDTPTPSVTPTPTDTPTPSVTPTSSQTPTITPTPTASATPTITPTPTDTPTPSVTPTPSQTPTITPTGSPTFTPTPTGTVSYPRVVTLPAGAAPNGLHVDTTTGLVYVTGRDTGRVYVIDGHTFAWVNDVAVGSLPWGVAVQSGKVYVANFGDKTISVLDTATLSLQRVIPVRGHPTFIKRNEATGRVIAVSYGGAVYDDNRLIVINPTDDRVEADVHAGGGGAWGLAINPNLNRAYVTTRDSGTLTSFDGNNAYTQLGEQTIYACPDPKSSPYGMDFDPGLDKLYIACAVEDNVDRAVIYRATAAGLEREAQTALGAGGSNGGGGVAANPTTGHVFFTNSLDGTVSIVSGATDTVIGTQGVGNDPFGAAVNPLTGQVFIGNRGDNSVTVLLDAGATIVRR